MARTSTFVLKVTLRKLVHRSASEAGSNRQDIDLTPLLGPSGNVRISKSIGQPSGGFTIAFADQILSSFLDTGYALIEPMDMIEIRASRTVLKGTLPLLMRGFVSEVRRSEAMGSDGTPSRSVVVRGQDSGKLLQNNSILWQYAVARGDPYVNEYAPLEENGLPVEPTKVSDFIAGVINNVVNPKIKSLTVFSSGAVKPFTAQCTVPVGTVYPTALGDTSGSLWKLMARVSDAPYWNELFVRDSEAGPVLVFRPRPARDIDQTDGGAFLLSGASDPGTVLVDASDVISLESARSDDGVANFFYVPPGANLLDTDFGITVGNLLQGESPPIQANDPSLYGLRLMEVGTSLVADTTAAESDQDPAPLTDPSQWVRNRIDELRALNQNNVLFETVSLVAKGSERFVPGQFLKLTRGATDATSYLVSVDHTIVPLQGWTTSCACERGNGFYKRDLARHGVGWREGRAGPFSPAPAPSSRA